MNSFMLFSNEMRPILQEQNKALTNNDVSKMLGQMWKDMPYDEKKPYVERAVEIKSHFHACNPDYTYTKSPRKRQKINKMRKFAPMDGQQFVPKREGDALIDLTTASSTGGSAPELALPADASLPMPAMGVGVLPAAPAPAASASASARMFAAAEPQPLSAELIQSVVAQVSAELQLRHSQPQLCVLL